MNRPPWAFLRRSDRLACQHPDVPEHVVRSFRLRHVDKPFRVVAVEPHLIDRLWSAAVPKFPGPVGREHEQRDASVPCFDDRGLEIGRSGSRSRQQNDGTPKSFRESERKKPGRSLVDQHPRVHPRMPDGADGERCRT